jgi:hypothetical protein
MEPPGSSVTLTRLELPSDHDFATGSSNTLVG